jgi:hypothetical protein
MLEKDQEEIRSRSRSRAAGNTTHHWDSNGDVTSWTSRRVRFFSSVFRDINEFMSELKDILSNMKRRP